MFNRHLYASNAEFISKRFTVHWENLGKDGDNKGVIYVDGVEANFYVNTMASNKGGSSSGVKLASGELKPFSFSDVVLTGASPGIQ